MDRRDLELLDREGLIARAEALGVTTPRVLTRPELVDELLLRSAMPASSRGLFGMARDLVARVIERGLHVAEAAELIGQAGGTTRLRRGSGAIPTVTLAGIYAAQGHRTRAVDMLKRVVEREPEHEMAATLLQDLQDASYRAPPVQLPPEDESLGDFGVTARSMPEEQASFCVAIPVGEAGEAGGEVFVTWKVGMSTLERLRRIRGEGELVVRVLRIGAAWEGPTVEQTDTVIGDLEGHLRVRAAVSCRVAVGWKTSEGFFPAAHSPAFERGEKAGELRRWTSQGFVRLDDSEADAALVKVATDRMAAL